MPFLKAEDTDMEVFPVVQNFDGTDFVPGISDFLNSPDARARFRREIALFLATDHYRGLMIDFESFPKKAQPGYVALLNELSSDLHAKGMKLYVSVQVRNEDFDYKAISAAADGVVIMNYDEHFPGGTPGPIASQDWFTDNLDSAVKEIPKEKLICSHSQLRIRLGRADRKRQPPSRRGRQNRLRAGSLDRRARFRRRR